ncbi:MAG: reverse transcriptase domain-containing protein [Patescibacteria group bacterium]
MSRLQFTHTYKDIISIENLLLAWKEFLKGKRSRKDVLEFQRNLMTNILSLHNELFNKTYRHLDYKAFKINDPKPRDIHKATVRDRLLHHLIYNALYPYFDKKFIYDSYSCRINKGTHKAIYRFESFIRKVSKNNNKQCWVLKCDIRKFFANIDHKILKSILKKYIEDKDILWLLSNVINSFSVSGKTQKGLPLGNLTSQLLVNVYMNEFDQFMKRKLKVEYYIRYADDFVVLSEDKKYLENILEKIQKYLEVNLKLEMHPDKVFIKTISSGVDFLGWVHFSKHRVLRTSTKRRMLRKLENDPKIETIQSYLGLISHGDTYKLVQKINSL